MKSITGIEFNNPAICIKGNPHFVCVCPPCKKEQHKRVIEWVKMLAREDGESKK